MGYITIEQVRDEGVDETQFPDPRVQSAIDVWSKFFDDATGQWFLPRKKTLVIDGTDSPRIFLPQPILSVLQLYANGDFVNVIDASLFRVYKERDEDRRNPKVELYLGERSDLIFSPAWRNWKYRSGISFLKGQQNQKIVGYFGFLDEGDPVAITGAAAATPISLAAPAHGLATGDWAEVKDVGGVTAANGVWQVTVVDANNLTLSGSVGAGVYAGGGQLVQLFTPLMVQRAVLLLALNNLGPAWDGEKATRQEYQRAYEMTDRSAVQYDTPAKLKTKGGTYAITKNMEVERIIQMYRAPIKLAVPGCNWLESG